MEVNVDGSLSYPEPQFDPNKGDSPLIPCSLIYLKFLYCIVRRFFFSFTETPVHS